MRSHNLFPRACLLLVCVALMLALAGCEEMAAPTAPKTDRPSDEPVRLYTEIGADKLLERWTVLPGGAIAVEASITPARNKLAAGTDGFDVLPPRFRFSAAHEYGACVVFTAKAEPIPGTGAWFGTMHVIDCVGDRHEKNPVEGLFHTALMCVPTAAEASERYSTWHIIRAGNFDPTTHPHPWWGEDNVFGSPVVHGETSVHPSGKNRLSDLYQWSKYFDAEKKVLLNWAFEAHAEYHREDHPGGGYDEWTVGKIELFPFDHLESSKELHFKIDHSRGVVEVEPNDGMAFKEYRTRCESLPPDPIL